MCCCDKPNINGTLGYKWQPNDRPSIRPVDPPTLAEFDTLLYDEPGRCGGQDSHCHHYRIVGQTFLTLLYKHGGGEGRVHLSNSKALIPIFASLDSNARYWLMNALYHGYSDGMQSGRQVVGETWRQAAAEKRIKTRKLPKDRGVKVWIEPAKMEA